MNLNNHKISINDLRYIKGGKSKKRNSFLGDLFNGIDHHFI